MAPAIGQSSQAPAAYVRAQGLDVERLEQRYERYPDGIGGPSFAYEAPTFAFACRIDYDSAGLALTYPGIAERAV